MDPAVPAGRCALSRMRDQKRLDKPSLMNRASSRSTSGAAESKLISRLKARLADPEAFDYIRSYSPYENVAARNYPPLFITAGLSDPRVTYWEPAKWAAKLRATKVDDNLLLLKTNMGAGHGGKSGRYTALEEEAEQLAFFLIASKRES